MVSAVDVGHGGLQGHLNSLKWPNARLWQIHHVNIVAHVVFRMWSNDKKSYTFITHVLVMFLISIIFLCFCFGLDLDSFNEIGYFWFFQGIY